MINYMQMAYEQAVKAGERGEVPVGAVLVDGDGKVLAQDGNRSIELSDPCGHAEIIVLRQGGQQAQNYRLAGATLYVTLEPCVMCVGAMIHARIRRLVFATPDPKTGAVSSLYSIAGDGKQNHSLEIESGVLADECSELLRDFFKKKRKKNKN